MRNLTLVAMAVIGIVACKDDPRVQFVDGMIVDPPIDSCGPLTQTGCSRGEKCTWINEQDNPPIGHIGCAPEGGDGPGDPIPPGDPCVAPMAGPMGYDACAKGTVCLSGECKQICDVNGGQPSCDGNHACSRYADFFESGGTAVAGVCDPAAIR